MTCSHMGNATTFLLIPYSNLITFDFFSTSKETANVIHMNQLFRKCSSLKVSKLMLLFLRRSHRSISYWCYAAV